MATATSTAMTVRTTTLALIEPASFTSGLLSTTCGAGTSLCIGRQHAQLSDGSSPGEAVRLHPPLTVSGRPSQASETVLRSAARGIGTVDDAPTVTVGIDRRLGPGIRLLMLPPIMLVSSPSASATCSSSSWAAGRSNMADAAICASCAGQASRTLPCHAPVTVTQPTVTSPPSGRAWSPASSILLPVNDSHTSRVIPRISSSVMLTPVRHGGGTPWPCCVARVRRRPRRGWSRPHRGAGSRLAAGPGGPVAGSAACCPPGSR